MSYAINTDFKKMTEQEYTMQLNRLQGIMPDIDFFKTQTPTVDEVEELNGTINKLISFIREIDTYRVVCKKTSRCKKVDFFDKLPNACAERVLKELGDQMCKECILSSCNKNML